MTSAVFPASENIALVFDPVSAGGKLRGKWIEISLFPVVDAFPAPISFETRQPEVSWSRMMPPQIFPRSGHFFAALALLGIAADLSAQNRRRGFELSTQYCMSCHGPWFAGGRASSLRNGDWNRVKTDADIVRIIKEGLPVEGMTPFGDVLSDDDIAALVGFIRGIEESEKQQAAVAIDAIKEGARESELESFSVESIVDGLQVPWSFAFLPDGRLIVTERAGALRFVEDGMLSEPVAGTPEVWARQDGGLFALALDPDFETNGWIYLSFAEPGAEIASSMTKLIRGRVRENTWVDEETVWSTPPEFYHESNVHYGTRLLFNDGFLYFAVGDRGRQDEAQNLASPFGKIHRINPDGSIPDSNPFVDTPGAWPSVWSYGHRNPQGLAVSPNGTMWSTEHGPMGGDELNVIRPGANYGWPLVTHGLEHSGAVISEFTSLPGMEDPKAYWVPSIATSAIEFYSGDRFPRWKNQLFLGSLLRQEFRRIILDGEQVVDQELVFKDLGRIRDIHTGPDGFIYIALERFNRLGAIVRLVPADQ